MAISPREVFRTAVMLILAAASVCAQGSVTIYGTVTDSAGAVMPGVTIKVTNTQTGAARQVNSDTTGNYVVVQLPVGVYSVEAKATGFKVFIQPDFPVQVNENRRVDVAMEIGQLSENITVKAELAQVETRMGTISEVVDSRRIADLPLNGRNPVSLQLLVAGVGKGGGQDQQQNPTISVNGSTLRSNNYMLDGGDNHDPFFNTPAPFPNPDALQEFSIETNSYGADKGRNTGIYVSAVTRSGTNQFHGSLFEYLRNKSLNTRNFFSSTVAPFKRNQYGGTFGGPVWIPKVYKGKDKTFFFVSFQGTKERSEPGAQTGVMPTAAERRGDFSGLSRQLTDPLGGIFPGNRIPASRLYQPSQKFLDTFVPLPNLPGNLLSFSSGQSVDDDQRIVKVDHQLSDSNRLTGRLLYNYNDLKQAVSNVPGFLASIRYKNWNVTVGDTWVISPTMVNQITFTRQNIFRKQLPITPGNHTWMEFGAGVIRSEPIELPAAHSTNVTGFFNAFTRFPLDQGRTFYQYSDEVSITRRSHLLRFGGDLRRSSVERVEWYICDPAFGFRGDISGNAMADFVLGRPSSFTQNSVTKWLPQGNEYALYFQDDWKTTRRLTLNLGLRWDPFVPPPDRQGSASTFVPGRQSTHFPTAPPGLMFQEDEGIPKATIPEHWRNFAPRFGFAFDPFGTGKTSFRGGYGLFYAVRALQQYDGTVGPGLNIQMTLDPVPGGIANPYASIPGGNPFPFTPPANAQERAKFVFPSPLILLPFPLDYKNALVQQWNFNVQQQIAGTYLVSAAYVASKGNHLESGHQANAGVYGIPGNLQQRRPYNPYFGSISVRGSLGNSTYHSMQLTLNRRMSNGITILTSYTWAKLMDDASPMDGKDFSREHAISGNNIAHRWVGSFIWELPKLKSQPAVLRYVAGGWETNGIVTLQSGSRFNVTSGRDNSGTGINSDRPDLVGNPYLSTDRPRGELIQRYFNTAAFVQNPAGTFGTTGRNILEGPGLATVDFGLVKNFALHEDHRIQFRFEAFNLFNRVNLGNPNGNINTAQVGRITSAGDPRVLQMALRYVF